MPHVEEEESLHAVVGDFLDAPRPCRRYSTESLHDVAHPDRDRCDRHRGDASPSRRARQRRRTRNASGTGVGAPGPRAFATGRSAALERRADDVPERSTRAARCTWSPRRPAARFDPQVNYTLQYWQLYQAMYDGLLAFTKVGGQQSFTVVPDLAEAMPKVTDGGKTYTFTLRKGIKFSTGQTVTPDDVVASFERIFKVSSPTAGTFYNGIVGAAACLKTPAHVHLSKGVIADDADQHGGHPPHRAGPGVPVQARRAARVDPAEGFAAEGRGQHADPDDRPVHGRSPTTRTAR